jgi:2-oxoglutarate ferredoxin oxidoreductase subunit beta
MGYGASFVAQGSPADMAGLARIIEEGIRFPGFAFINIQSPCVTYGEEEQQLKAQKTKMQSLESIAHDPADRARATELAREYGTKLYTGILYRNPNPPPTYGQGVNERQQALKSQAVLRHEILNRFMPSN